jgi:hypothetical protein
MAWSNGVFTRTDGTFTGANVWAKNFNSGVKVVASRHDTHDEDLADGIDSCIEKAGNNSPSANIPMNGFKHTGCGDAAARDQFATVGQVQNSEFIFGGTTGGSATAYTLTMSPTITAYVSGMIITFVVHASNTGTTPTLNIDSVGAKTITRAVGAVAANDMLINKVAMVVYNGVADDFQLVNPATKV